MPDPQSWWLAAGGQVFGPYEADQLGGFLQQGRLAATSRMAPDPQGPFAAAAEWPALSFLFQTAGAASPAPRSTPAQERALMVLAALRETPADMLETALLAFGPAVRVKGTLWACRARLPASGLRNAVSRKLGPGEFLFVAEIDVADTAWFNLDGEVDRAVRRLWAAGGG